MMPVTNPKAWEAFTGFTANIKAAVERLNKLAGYFPGSKDHLIVVAARIGAGCAPLAPEVPAMEAPADYAWPRRIEGA
jgi:hypothetical protein